MFRTLLLCLCLLSGAVPGAVPGAVAQDDSDPPASCAAEECPVLTLDAFLGRVLRTSPNAQSLRLEQDRATAALLDARGGFDPVLIADYEYKTDDASDKLNVLRSGLAMPFDVLMSPSLTLDYRRGVGSSVDPSVLTASEGETRLGVSFQPLEGLGMTKRRAALRKARLGPRRADARQAEQRNRLLLEATTAFWSWVEARRTLAIHRDLLTFAQQRRDFVVRETRAGDAAAMDSVEAALSVVAREGKLAAARRKAEAAAIKLAVFLWRDDGTPEAFRYAPPALPAALDALDGPDGVLPDSTAALATALDRRPELRDLDVKMQQLRIERQLARQRLRPDVKVEAQMVSYDSRPSGLDDVKVGFKIEQPLFFRSGRSATERADIETQDLRFKRDLVARKIQADVNAARVAIRQTQRRVDAAARRAELAERLQQAEQRRFELGESTLFLVNQREQAFAEAREEHVAARVALLQAAAEARWATGTIADGAGQQAGR